MKSLGIFVFIVMSLTASVALGCMNAMVTYYPLWMKIPLVISSVIVLSFIPSVVLVRFSSLARIVCTVLSFFIAAFGWTFLAVEEGFQGWDGFIATNAMAVVITIISVGLWQVLARTKHRVLNIIIVILFFSGSSLFFNLFGTKAKPTFEHVEADTTVDVSFN